MLRTHHFISGLPRSGSTLLGAVLSQNPDFISGVSSPMATLVDAIHSKMSGPGDFAFCFDDSRRVNVLRGLFDSYYSNIAAEKVVFDTNRSWTGTAALLTTLYPDCRIIACVRNVGWIIDSIERMLVQNPLQCSAIFNVQTPPRSVYSRVDLLMNPETGLIGRAWSTLRECWFGENANRLIVIQFESLVKDPAAVLEKLYAALNKPAFKHEFDNLAFTSPHFDAILGMPGLHDIRKKIKPVERRLGIPPEVFAKFSDCNFWLRPEQNPRGVVVL